MPDFVDCASARRTGEANTAFLLHSHGAIWLGLTPFKFIVSQVGYDKDIERLLSTVG